MFARSDIGGVPTGQPGLRQADIVQTGPETVMRLQAVQHDRQDHLASRGTPSAPDPEERADLSRGSARETGPRPLHAGATLIYGPSAGRPDLVLAAQFLVDDLRADGIRVSSLRVNQHTLRVRLDGMELALALSPGPLPAQSLHGLRRPLGRRLQPAMRGKADPTPADATEPVLTDLGSIRVIRALRQHRAAMGVLLRRRGPAGQQDPERLLHRLLDSLSEAAAPALILWQRSGLIFTPCEYRAASLADLAPQPAESRPLHLPARLYPVPVRADGSGPDAGGPDEGVPDEGGQAGAGEARVAVLPARAETSLREARAKRRSAGRLFRRKDESDPELAAPNPGTKGAKAQRVITLPRLEMLQAGLVRVFRAPTGPEEDRQRTTSRRIGTKMVLGLWFALILPGWSAVAIFVIQ